MTETIEEKVSKPDFKLRLSEKYAIDTDKLNIILKERYETRVGKGKFADYSGEFAYKSIAYFQTFDRLADWLVQNAMFTTDSVEHMYEFADQVVELKKEMAGFLKDKVVIQNEDKKKGDE